ncbi:tetratricopeptide repeat protein [Actinoplanes sp. NPDC049668]|uniref:AfsR/SARP family transcriptional regulator n=1 Tax=unclassified Actinoplanes TaxID=2626549 RepID=UPI0033BECC8C
MVELRLLGDVDVRHDGRPVALGSKQRAVLAVLAFHANTVVSRADLVRLAWGGGAGDPPVTIDRLVTDYVSRLRTAFRKAGFGDQVRLVSRAPGYLLEVDPDVVDWHRFRDLVAQARADDGDAAGSLRLAMGLWRGPALADLTERSLDPIRDRMSDLRLAATEDLAAALLARGGTDEVIDLLTPVAAGQPGRERAATLLIRSLHAAGRRDEAIEVYRRTHTDLTGRLGVDPTDALDEAYRTVLDGRAPVPVPAQLPADTGNFTGRRAELAQLLDLAPGTPSGVVVICAVDGMGGIGKTALAVHAAHRLSARFPDGCLFLDLHGYTRAVAAIEPGQALERLLRALGVPGDQIPAEVDDRAALYRGRLAGRRMLIVLDNARTADQVRPLLPAEPGCLVLVTSRRRLTALDDARPLSLESLPLADAVTLFTRIAGPGAAGDPGAAERVVRLCGRLPLAVRIAAARLRARPAWTAAHLAELLADRLGQLHDGERGVAAAFALSYDDLTDEQRRTFRRLGLHPGADADPYAVAALTGLRLDAAGRILEELLDAHLLIQAVPGRYRFHDLMRAYAADLAGSQDPDDARRTALSGLFDHYLATAAAAMDALFPAGKFQRPRVPPAGSPSPVVADPAAARAWLDAERPNLVAVCSYAAADGRPGYTGRLAATLGLYLDFGGHFADALTVHAHAGAAAGRCGDLAAEGNALANLGTSLDGLGRHAEAVDHLRHALLNFREIGHRAGEARALNNLGYAYCRWGRHRQAVDCTRQGLAIFLETGNRLGQADALDTLGIVHRQQGRYDEATEHSREALALYRELGDPLGEAMQLERLGAIHARQGRHEQAVDHLRRALALDREIGNRPGEADALNELALVRREQGRFDAAIDHHRQAIDLFRGIGNRTGEGSALNGLAETLHATGQHDRALDLHNSVLTLTADTDAVAERARAHAGIANIYHAAGDPKQALWHWRRALALNTDLDRP